MARRLAFDEIVYLKGSRSVLKESETGLFDFQVGISLMARAEWKSAWMADLASMIGLVCCSWGREAATRAFWL
jgi:hypothetical protein